MIVTDITVKKVDHADPRYPDPMAVPFSDVYLLTVTMQDGSQQECPFFVTEFVGEMTLQRVSDMLRLFSSAVTDFDQKQAVA